MLPEQNDTDLSDALIIERVNTELVATWGNLVNRVLSMTARAFDGEVPSPGPLTDADRAVVDAVDQALVSIGRHVEAVELRAGLRAAMEAAGGVNAYLNAEEPWKLTKTDPDRAATVLWSALQAIAGLRVAFAPYLPFSSASLGTMLGVGEAIDGWRRNDVPAGTAFGSIQPLFTKLEPDALDD